MSYYQFDNIILSMTTKMSREDLDPAESVNIWPPGSGSVTNSGITDPDIRIWIRKKTYGSTTLTVRKCDGLINLDSA
jgi:hypothetical protein